ncbi:MAG: ABC transporter ATP-binding protein [Sporolactobacillus sp.]
MNYLRHYWRKYAPGFFFALFFLTLEAFADLAQPTLMAQIIDRGVATHRMSIIVHYGLLMLLVTAGGALCASARNVLSVSVSQRFARDLRHDLYRHVVDLPIERVESFGRATLITRLTADVTRVQTFANGMMRIMMKAPIIGAGSLVMAILLDWRLALILFALIPLIAGLIRLNMRLSFPYYQNIQRALDSINRSVQDYLEGVRVVKIFDRMSDEAERFDEKNRRLGHLSVSATRVNASWGAVVNLTVNAAIVAVLLFGGIGVNSGSVHVGVVVAFTNYVMQLLFAIMIVNNALSTLVRARASAERIGAVMGEKQTMTFGTRPQKRAKNGASLTFSDVHFAYPSKLGNWSLKQLSFDVAHGQVFGVTGPIGSGKTTLAKLMLRFYDPQSGRICLDGVSLLTFSERDLRQRIAFVPQTPFLFSGTVADNIRWGRPEASEEELVRAARLAEADAFICRTPHGYESVIGEGGVNLSGGQKQRLSLARALIRRPELLILDDATSAVDAITDQKVMAHLADMKGDMTVILISQRAASLAGVDQLLVLNAGGIEAFGTPAELLKTSAYYQAISGSQIVLGGEN